MKTSGLMKLWSVVLAVALVGSVSMAGDHWRGHGGYDRGRGGGHGCYPSYHHPRGEWVVGLLGLGILAAAVSSAERTVYVQPAPVVVRQPEVVYVQPAPVIQVEAPRPATVTINIQNTNGSMTPVTLHPVGSQWVGPRGEVYDYLPTVGQLRPVYGF